MVSIARRLAAVPMIADPKTKSARMAMTAALTAATMVRALVSCGPVKVRPTCCSSMPTKTKSAALMMKVKRGPERKRLGAVLRADDAGRHLGHDQSADDDGDDAEASISSASRYAPNGASSMTRLPRSGSWRRFRSQELMSATSAPTSAPPP